MVDLESKQKVWADQLPLFKENYILTSDLDLLEFDMITGQFDIKPNQGNDGFDDEDSLVLYHSVNTAWAMWLRCNRLNLTEIEALKAKLAKIESDEFVVVKKEDIENWYLDEGEYVWYEKDSIDGYLEDLDNGEVLEVQRKEYVVINSNPVFATNVYEDADNINWELFDSKEEAEKAATHCKAMVEAQGDGDE